MAYGDDDVRGVGGWLAFFLITLGVISPLFYIVTSYLALSDPAVSAAYGEVWPTLLRAEIALTVLVVGLSLFTAWRFLRVFNWTTVRFGIGAMWTLAVLSIFGEALIVSMIAGIPFGELLAMSAGPEFIRPFIYCGIWTAYLLISKRVRNTYGRQSDGETAEVFA